MKNFTRNPFWLRFKDIFIRYALAFWVVFDIVCFTIGAMWIMAQLPFIKPDPPQEDLQIILDGTELVRCRSVDRSQPACVLLTGCTDRVDRCVQGYEVIRRPLRTADYLPRDD